MENKIEQELLLCSSFKTCLNSVSSLDDISIVDGSIVKICRIKSGTVSIRIKVNVSDIELQTTQRNLYMFPPDSLKATMSVNDNIFYKISLLDFDVMFNFAKDRVAELIAVKSRMLLLPKGPISG